MRRGSMAWMGALVAASLVAPARGGTAVSAPLVCTRGPDGQRFAASVSMPAAAPRGSIYSVRIDGASSGTISHFGLNYVHDMETTFAVPPGAVLAAGSLHIVPDTGTANVSAGARVLYDAGLVRLVLPGRVTAGSSYVPPSIELALTASAPAGSALAIDLVEYRVTANAFLVGEVLTVCEPVPKPYPLGATRVTAAALPSDR